MTSDPDVSFFDGMMMMADQRKFLKDHADLISPWRFPLPVRIQLQMGRLVVGWQKAAEKKA